MEDLLLFDINKATEIIGSKPESLKLISILLKELEEIKLKINTFAKLEDKRQLRDLLHSTIGMAAYCGTPLFSFQLKTLQQKLQNQEVLIDNYIKDLNTTIDSMLNTAIEDL